MTTKPTAATIWCDAFWRAWNRDASKRNSSSNVRTARFAAPATATISDLLELARAAGASCGTAQTGVFEIQTDDGIWQHTGGQKIDVSTTRRAANVQFRTWDQLDAEEA